MFFPLLLTVSAPRQNAMATRIQRSDGRMLPSNKKSILLEVLKLWVNEYEAKMKSQEEKKINRMTGEGKLKKSGPLGGRIKLYRHETK